MVRSVLQRPTLVLNRNWQPVNVATVARALVLVWNESARVVDPQDYQLYTWADWSRLRAAHRRAVHPGGPVPAAGAGGGRLERLRPAAGGRTSPSAAGTFSSGTTTPASTAAPSRAARSLTLDHVLPRSQGGVSNWENCVLACMACNKRKADRTPEQARMRLRRHPVRPTWKPLYADHSVRIESWSKFISEAYWNVTLRE